MNNPCQIDSECPPPAVITDPPNTCDEDTPNGMPGNFFTVGGRHFGSYIAGVSQLTIGGVAATFPAAVCGNTWTDNQIIMVVPVGAASGPVEVTNSANYSDSINDSRGPVIEDFLINNIARPGLCLANPNQGPFQTPVNLTGIRFGPANLFRTIEFGNDVSFVTAGDPIIWTDFEHASMRVPNLVPGNTSIRMRVDGIRSNYLGFKVLAGTAGDPFISYLDPIATTTDSYVTIFGGNFGNTVGNVLFDGLPIVIDFPEACLDKYWNNTYIIFKVPATAAVGSHLVRVKTAAGKESNEVDFTVRAGPPSPGICGLEPDNGPINTPVDFFGDNFGSSAGQVVFYQNRLAVGGIWSNQSIFDAQVPLGAVSGTVYAESAANQESNRVPFQVGACSDDSQCAPDVCCPDNTCRATCPEQIDSVYGWSFTTGDYFIAQSCVKDVEIPATGPTGQNVCINAQNVIAATIRLASAYQTTGRHAMTVMTVR